jgi:hypothetical protein
MRLVKKFNEEINIDLICQVQSEVSSVIVGSEVPVAFELFTIGLAVLALIVPDESLADNAKARAIFLPVSRAAGDDLLAAKEAEVGATRSEADHVVATLGLEDLLLATRTLLVVLSFGQLLERVLFRHLSTTMSRRTDDVAGPRFALLASKTATQRAANRSRSFGSQVRAANRPANAAAVLAVQAGFHRHRVFLHLLSPRVQEVSVEQVPESPQV